MHIYHSLLVAGAVVLAQTPPALAGGLISCTPAVTLVAPVTETQGQLAAQLRAEGYDNVRMSFSYPTTDVTHPELYPSFTDNAAQTPTHLGWNGVAEKNGEIIQIYVTR